MGPFQKLELLRGAKEWGLGLTVQGLGFRVLGLGWEIRIQRVEDVGFGTRRRGFEISNSGGIWGKLRGSLWVVVKIMVPFWVP